MSTPESTTRRAEAPATLAGVLQIGGELTVKRLGFGAMRLPGARGGDARGGNRLLHRAIELGVNFLDTAHAYGHSEQLIGEALYPYPDDLVIATKAGLERGGADGRPETIRRHAERSLQVLRLGGLPPPPPHNIYSPG